MSPYSIGFHYVDHGLVHAKNRRLQNEIPECLEQQLQQGDEILRVNGFSDAEEMRDELFSASEIHMQVVHMVPPSPPPPPPDDSNRTWFWSRKFEVWIDEHDAAEVDSSDSSSEPAFFHTEGWRKYVDHAMNVVWFWNALSKDWFFECDAKMNDAFPWRKYTDPVDHDAWYWNCASGEFFFEASAKPINAVSWSNHEDQYGRAWWYNSTAELSCDYRAASAWFLTSSPVQQCS